MEKITLVLLSLFSIGIDVWAFHSRCDLSPKVNLSMMLFAVTIQSIGMAFSYASYRVAAESFNLKFRRFLFVMALSLVGTSIPLVQFAVLYSDTIGHRNWDKSIGLQCRHA